MVSAIEVIRSLVEEAGSGEGRVHFKQRNESVRSGGRALNRVVVCTGATENDGPATRQAGELGDEEWGKRRNFDEAGADLLRARVQ